MSGWAGIGKFTIADEAIVNEADLGVNFFLDEQCLGKRRSQCCAELLQELNPDVKGTVRHQSSTVPVSAFDFNLEGVAVHHTRRSVARRCTIYIHCLHTSYR